MKTIRQLLLLAVVLGATATANAAGKSSGFMLNLVPSYETTELTSSGTTVKSTQMTADFTLGYLLDAGVLLGVAYQMDNTTNDPGGSTNNISAYGPAVGYYHDMGFFILGSYLLSWSQKVSSSDTTYTGDGIEVDVGYIYRFGTFGLGAELVYKTVNIKKQKDAAGVESDLSNKAAITGLPRVVFNWVF
ncbi:MAG: hypothetical protein ABL958_04925 [Bdellovibrionia bacterium]